MVNKLEDDSKKRLNRSLEAIGRLLSNDDFQCFVDDYLVEGLFRKRDANDELTGEALVRGQGEARAYREIIQFVDKSPSTWVRIKTQEGIRLRGKG